MSKEKDTIKTGYFWKTMKNNKKYHYTLKRTQQMCQTTDYTALEKISELEDSVEGLK